MQKQYAKTVGEKYPGLLLLQRFLKCPYYAFSNITFHAVGHVVVCEHKLSAKLRRRQCMINKVIVYQKKVLARNRLNESLGIQILFCYGCMSQSNSFA